MKNRAPRNQTLDLTEEEKALYGKRLLKVEKPAALSDIINRTICGNIFEVIDYLPSKSVDLIIADPPYNLTKSFSNFTFTKTSLDDYASWLETWIPKLLRIMKPEASIYICGDWRSSAAIHSIVEKLLIVRNRITWEREKGRGASKNWKNCSEDIWFCTMSNNYTFNVDNVKLKRRVIAPYTHEDGTPKDWEKTDKGDFRLTHPSNFWSDLTVPFWSMPENTDHPTQKPEKLVAKLILASSNEGDVIFDPFLGAGTTSVVAKKLKRHYIGVEIDETYCCLSEKRLELADENDTIQGYDGECFYDRNIGKVHD